MHHEPDLIHVRCDHNRWSRCGIIIRRLSGMTVQTCVHRPHDIGVDLVGNAGETFAYDGGHTCFGARNRWGLNQLLEKYAIALVHHVPSFVTSCHYTQTYGNQSLHVDRKSQTQIKATRMIGCGGDGHVHPLA